MDGFTRRKEKSKEDIRKAAWELFSQFGVERVSISDIARKAHVSPATIYNNFEGKDELVREFVTTMVEQLENRVKEIILPDRPFWEKMTVFIEFVSGTLAQGRPSAVEGAVFTRNLQQDPEIQKIREAARERMSALMLGLIEEGREQGEINPEISNEALGVYFRAFMDIFSTPELQPLFYRNPQVVRDLGSLMFYGLSGEAGK
ncbi:MAG: TetR/AcrR family transcriptional regulator [Ardenticatenaceae bacterium]|nr:TetR/AcrR family transcriptional regulator [Ardenticatenaceae bacterium]